MLEPYRYFAGKYNVEFHVFELSGEDVQEFLHKQSTFDVKSLGNKEFHLISFLDPQGRLEFYCWVLKQSSSSLLLIPHKLRNTALARLERFLISEDVTIVDKGPENWTFIIGPKGQDYGTPESFKGLMLEESSWLIRDYDDASPDTISDEEFELWRLLNGWPDFDGNNFSSEIINNSRLFELSLSLNKGCYPGQETVLKINSRRGAAYSEVLIQTSRITEKGPIFIFGKKIGDIENCFEWKGSYFSSAKLLRDFRVADLKIDFIQNTDEIEGFVRYFPLLTSSLETKSQDLFYEATECFKKDDFEQAEAKLRLAIDLNPQFADAYESLGVMLGRLERYQEAIELMDQLSKIDQSSVLAHTNKSLFLMKIGKIDEAEEQKSLATVKSFQKFGDEARLKEELHKQQKAKEDEWLKRESMFAQVLEIDSEDTLANYGIGSIAVEKKNWDKAVDHLEKVLKQDPNYSVAYLSLGLAYKGLGKKQMAEKVWREGIKIAAQKGDLMPANQMQLEIQSL